MNTVNEQRSTNNDQQLGKVISFKSEVISQKIEKGMSTNNAFHQSTNNQQPTTNNQQPTTNNQPTTNIDQPPTI